VETELKKVQMKLAEFEKNDQLLIIGNLFIEMLQRIELLNHFKTDHPEIPCATVGSFLSLLEKEEKMEPKVRVITPWLQNWIVNNKFSFMLNDILLANRTFQKTRNRIGYMLDEEDVVIAISGIKGQLHEFLLIVFQIVFPNSSFDQIWNQFQ